MAKDNKDDRGAAERAVLYGYKRDNENDNEPKLEKSSEILKLLQQVKVRLEDVDQERTEIWDTIKDQHKILTELEDRSTSTEKTYLAIENRLSRSEMDDSPLAERLDKIEEAQKESAKEGSEELRREILDKMEESDLHTVRLIERIDEAMAMQTRMNRRIDKVVQDKQRLNRKLSRLEENVDLTRNALSSKALVLLTDKGIVQQTGVPEIPVFQTDSDGDDFFDDYPKNKLQASQENNPVFTPRKKPTQDNSVRHQILAASFFVALAAGAGWFISNNIETPSPMTSQNAYVTDNSYTRSEPVAQTPRFEDNNDFYANRAQPVETVNFSQPHIQPERVTLAEAMNNIEPASTNNVEEPARNNTPLIEETVQTPVTQTAPADVANVTPNIFKADQNLPEQLKTVEMEAFKGDAEAQHDLAVMYTAGRGGVSQNFDRAAYWFEKASNQGIANARYNLGVLYHQGLGVEKDLSNAINWYTQAAELGHGEAQYNLGIAFIEGIGVDYDPARAAQFFESAAASGVPEAAFNLGLIYENGLTGTAQPDEAILWYKTASDLGNPDARNAMEQLARSLNIKPEEIDRLIENLRAPGNEQRSQLSSAETSNTVIASQANTISEIQRQLITFGLYPGPADGSFGPLTSDAIRLYQSRHEIPVTGEPSEELLVHMLTKNLRNSSFIELGSGE